ncbi:AMP-binding protein [Cohnella endophytica]|uniref:AMP-binding protein n=1 Tax=Cohnella endophytica TaxID=2419778 RepID=UPI001314C5EB|nr:AMP-binding protein [Cohnella endophytica]
MSTALEIARKIQADYLLYDQWDSIYTISEQQMFHPPSLMQYSSGTTGEPKLITREWRDIQTEIENYNLAINLSDEEQPCILVPISHSFGLIAGVLSALYRETPPHIIWNKNPKFALHLIQNNPKSIVYGVPFLFQLLDSLGKDELRFHKLISSGAPLPERLFDRLTHVSKELRHQYGSSETGCISIATSPSSPFDVGKPLKHIQLSFARFTEINEKESLLNEIIVTSDFQQVNTHDIGFVSGSGSLHVIGRSDDLINVSGLKVNPAEVENVIGKMPGVVEVAVFKQKHKVWGEAVKAIVVTSGLITEEQIKIWCMERIPSFKVPSIIELVNEIPKMPSGKLSRKLIQEWEYER